MTTAKIADGAVTGAKINLPTVGKVPSATSADSAGNANTVDGNTISAVNFTGNPTIGPTQILGGRRVVGPLFLGLDYLRRVL